MPRAYIEMILSSKPVNRLCPLATILGSKLPCRSRGVSSSSSSKSPFSTLRPLPLRLFPLCCPAGSCFSYPRWSVSSACSARSRIAFVSCFSRPFSPMMSSGFLYPASIWAISALSIAIGADSPLPMVGYTVPYTAPIRPLFHQKEERVKAHVLVAFLAYALWVTLKHLLQRRPIVPQPSASGVDNAQPFSPMKALALLSTLQSADIVLPTTDGREIRLRRITEPTAEQKSLLHGLGLSLPERLKSTAKCSADFATA